jgi:8-oxo-dGTP diphosphatase
MYTICFIRHEDKLLLLNRYKAPNMGLWNGVGGKLDADESPLQGIAREIYEETGLSVSDSSITFGGNVRWVSDSFDSGMYLFYCELPPQLQLDTPVSVDEGVLMWHSIAWVLDENNDGVVDNIKYFLPFLLAGQYNMEHLFTYNEQDQLLSYQSNKLQQQAFISS